MNKGKLTVLCHKISKDKGIPFNTVLTYYFLESVLRCLANSRHSDHFVFKAGFLLSSILGLNTPSTVDIDFLFHNLTLNENRLQDVVDEILPEVDEDQYGGFRVRILCQLENIRQIVPVGIATGDVITPEALDYSFK